MPEISKQLNLKSFSICNSTELWYIMSMIKGHFRGFRNMTGKPDSKIIDDRNK
jgi:hypothetical protein